MRAGFFKATETQAGRFDPELNRKLGKKCFTTDRNKAGADLQLHCRKVRPQENVGGGNIFREEGSPVHV